MSLEVVLLFGLALFSVGLYGVLSRRNLIAVLIGVELMLNAASVNFMAFGASSEAWTLMPMTGPLFVLFIIGLAAAEIAIALSIVLLVFRERRAIRVEELTELKG